jgi:hypothetical protein
VFHHNTFLKLALACPHFKSGRLVEDFSMIVMRSYADGSASLAIDEFPEMREDAIEEFWIRKVEERREARERFFLEVGGEGGGAWGASGGQQQLNRHAAGSSVRSEL